VLSESRNAVTLAGPTVLRFGTDGRVAEHRDYLTMQDGRRLPPAGFHGAPET